MTAAVSYGISTARPVTVKHISLEGTKLARCGLQLRDTWKTSTGFGDLRVCASCAKSWASFSAWIRDRQLKESARRRRAVAS